MGFIVTTIAFSALLASVLLIVVLRVKTKALEGFSLMFSLWPQLSAFPVHLCLRGAFSMLLPFCYQKSASLVGRVCFFLLSWFGSILPTSHD